ncbi:MAG: hypothetical protein PHE43_01540 [Candidatus Nanoarchaeia archaeon]|nr:hypothetical protein [Candidatus Nanoarchaeia archaeon]
MLRCPNCGYLLVLLPKRNKYKCSRCGGLFPQKEIDNKEFREWDERQRLQDVENIKSEKKPKIKLSEEEKIKRAKESREKNYYKNRDKILVRKKEYRREIKERENVRRKAYRYQEIERTRQLSRIHWLRQRQKALALGWLKNTEEKAYNANIFISPPTSLPYHLLSQFYQN